MSRNAEKKESRTISQQAEPREEFCDLTATDLDAVSGGGRLDGISYLVAVTQMKANH
jgi:hypothetical protein